jgi:selenocysteine-specific elongation factor
VQSLDEKTVLHPDVIAEASQRITTHLSENGSATASDLRQLLDTSRRVAMPLLEHLDAIGLTRREGDLRHLVSSALSSFNYFL